MTAPAVVPHDLTVAAIEDLLTRHSGRVSPQLLLDEARNPSSPFHKHFEWDDTAAAERYRLVQASAMIREWRGTVLRIDTGTRRVLVQPTRRVHSALSERGRGRSSYETTEQIMANPAKRRALIETLLKELTSYRRRYAEILELSKVWAAIDAAARVTKK
jgi:hypothetical protein